MNIMSDNLATENSSWEKACLLTDLIPESGVCALINGQQVALFFLPDEKPSIYAIGNWDPLGKANVLSRGIIGDVQGELVVASPLYKQHFDLKTGRCIEDDSASVPVFPVAIEDDQVLIQV